MVFRREARQRHGAFERVAKLVAWVRRIGNELRTRGAESSNATHSARAPSTRF
jgi:hypothetical protein